jgi:hypothetical protein
MATQLSHAPRSPQGALKDAAIESTVGTVLDDIAPDANRVASALRNGLGQSVVKRHAVEGVDRGVRALCVEGERWAN